MSSPDDFDLDVELGDSTQVPTRVYFAPSRPRLLIMGSIIVTMMLAVVLIWSMRQAEPRPAPPMRSGPAPAAEATPSPVRAADEVHVEASIARTRTIELPQPRRVPTLLALVLGEIREGATLQPLRLADAFGRGVTVVNLWATFCEPCLRELPAFRAAFAAGAASRASAGRSVQFVPVMVDHLRRDDATQAAVLAELRTIAANGRMLVDPGDELNGALRAAEVYEGASVLPVTLVFTCDELAWVHLGEVDLDRLNEMVRQVPQPPRCERATRASLTPSAPPAPNPAPRAVAPTTRGCGDGRCDRTADETCASCRADCGCALGLSCIVNASGATHCARDETALKD